MPNFQHLTGRYFDAKCQALGIRPIALRYGNSRVITPAPLVSHDGVQPASDISSQLSDAEALDTYSVSIPEASLVQAIGRWEDAVKPDAIWYVKPGKVWVKTRVLGQYTIDTGRRIGFKLVVGGFGDA